MTSNRREFLRTAITGAVGLSITTRAFGQAASPITATKLSPSLVLLSGNGGNVALVIGSSGLMLIDAGLPNRAGELVKTIASLDSHPVTTVFNTHWHSDHVGANETLGKAGARIVAHENTRKHLASGTLIEALKMKIEPLQKPGIPVQTFSSRGTLTFDKETIDYVPVPPAHTDGDAYTFFPAQNVMHTGDLLFKDVYPFIDYSTGGWIGGMVAATDAMYRACDAKTRVIPGHGAMATREDLKRSHDMLTLAQQRLSAFAKKGASVEEVVKAEPLKDLDPTWGRGFMNAEGFLHVTYTGLLRQNERR
jgi:cyclase